MELESFGKFCRIFMRVLKGVLFCRMKEVIFGFRFESFELERGLRFVIFLVLLRLMVCEVRGF